MPGEFRTKGVNVALGPVVRPLGALPKPRGTGKVIQLLLIDDILQFANIDRDF